MGILGRLLKFQIFFDIFFFEIPVFVCAFFFVGGGGEQ